MDPKRLYDRLGRRNFANVRFRDLVTLIETLGYELRRIQGDHHLFKHPIAESKLNLQPERSGDAKKYQVRQVADAIRKYDLRLED
jgi:predicted RNA binding protein YcfA (HicA-like mRNA interferase family)